MTAPARFKEIDVVRAMKGARKAGFTNVRVTIEPNGKIIMDAGDEVDSITTRANPLDRVLRSVA